MAGIYLHIPFCKQRCHYCNFHFSTSLHFRDELIAALFEEIRLQKGYLSGEKVRTVYFGGGTPSLLPIATLSGILKTLRENFELDYDAEITLEANPDDITVDLLAGWKENGINRLSIGVQSFFEDDLRWMNRAHSAIQAQESLELATLHFNNISLDLIYGTPLLTNERWKYNVDRALSLGIPHLSCYALTVEPLTPLEKMIRDNRSSDVDPDKQSAQFLLLMEWMEQAAYEHYEISNFAKREQEEEKSRWRSRHNAAYWQGETYLGLGPSAHSYNGNERQWNIAHNGKYIAALQAGTVPFEKEILTPVQKWNEYIMTALRTREGIDVSLLPAEQRPALLEKSRSYLETGLMLQQDGKLLLTREGKLLADGIAARLFF